MHYLCIHSLRSLFAAKDSFEMKLFYFSHNGCHPKAFNSAGFTFKVFSAKEFSASGSLNQLSRWQMKLFKTFICLKICSKYLFVFDKKFSRTHTEITILHRLWTIELRHVQCGRTGSFMEMSCSYFLHKQICFYKTSSYRFKFTLRTSETQCTHE